MTTSVESERIAQVYREYQASAMVQTRWDIRNRGNQEIMYERQRTIHALFNEAGLFPLANIHVLEIGCGSGSVLANIQGLGGEPAKLVGVDLLPVRIAEAAQRYPAMNFLPANGEALPFADASFDLVLFFTVFSSILDRSMAQGVAAEATRVLRNGGAVLWYDFRYDNPRNPHVRGMNYHEIQSLFPGYEYALRTTTLMPPLARRLGRATSLLYPLLVQLPLLRTHYLGLLWKRATDG